jgi:hypothetical protein
MKYTVRAIFRPETLNERNGKEYSDQYLKALDLYFATPIRTIEAKDEYHAHDILYDLYLNECGIGSPQMECKFLNEGSED